MRKSETSKEDFIVINCKFFFQRNWWVCLRFRRSYRLDSIILSGMKRKICFLESCSILRLINHLGGTVSWEYEIEIKWRLAESVHCRILNNAGKLEFVMSPIRNPNPRYRLLKSGIPQHCLCTASPSELKFFHGIKNYSVISQQYFYEIFSSALYQLKQPSVFSEMHLILICFWEQKIFKKCFSWRLKTVLFIEVRFET